MAGKTPMRKQPKQARAKATIDGILNATTRLLAKSDERSITTNHIAGEAGLSIGTLYQYFPNKDAILLAVSERHRQAIAEQIIARLSAPGGGDLEDNAREIVRALIGIFRNSEAAKKFVATRLLQYLEGEAAPDAVDHVSGLIAEQLVDRTQRTEEEAEICAFILTRSIVGVVRSAAFDRPQLLHDPAFEDQLVDLAIRIARRDA